MLWTKLRVSLVEFLVGAAGCIKACSWYLWLHISTEATQRLFPAELPGLWPSKISRHSTRTTTWGEFCHFCAIVLLFFLQVKSGMCWPCTDALLVDVKLKRESRVSLYPVRLREQDAAIWTVRMKTSLCGEWRFGFIPPLSTLELTRVPEGDWPEWISDHLALDKSWNIRLRGGTLPDFTRGTSDHLNNTRSEFWATLHAL